MPEIVVKKKAKILERYIMGDKAVAVGRLKENDISLDDESVSEDHCTIKKTAGKLVVEDLNTAFGTRVNGEPVRKQDVKVGDKIEVGSHVLKISPVAEDSNKDNGFLLGVQGRMEGRLFELEPEVTKIGRSEEFNDLWISKKVDKSVSRRHATISRYDNKYVLEDKRSKNRTFVNQKQVNEESEVNLVNGDEILIGKSIFRFIKGKENFNWAPAKKAGVFWVRNLSLFRKVAALLLIAGSVFFIHNGITALQIINERPASVTLENLDWYPDEFIPTEEGYLGEDDRLDVTPSPAIGDITGNGRAEVVMADASGKVYAWSGTSGALIWKEELGSRKLTSPILADMNNNGIMDVVVGAGNSRVYVLDGLSGSFLYRSDFIGGRLLSGSAILVDDLDNSGVKDIVAVTEGNIISFMFSPVMGGEDPYYFNSPEDIMSSPVILKSDTGDNKVAVPTNGGQIYIFDSSNPDDRVVVNVTQRINMYMGTNIILNEINTVPAVADLNGDGTEDMIITTTAYYVVALSGADFSLMWAHKIEPYSMLAEPLRNSSPVISDFTGNGLPDVALGWANGKIMALNGSEGELIWEYEADEEIRFVSSPALADFNKDEIMDMIIADEEGNLYVINPREGASDRIFTDERLNTGITSTPVIGDVTGNGYLEVIVTSLDNEIHKFSLPTRVFQNRLEWPNFRNDARNSGSKFFIDTSPLYKLYSGMGGVILVGVFLVASFLKKKKAAKRPKIIDGRKKK